MRGKATYSYDNSAPLELKTIQEWFAETITRRYDEERIPMSSAPYILAEEPSKYIASSPTQNPNQRVQIYNQQYWWRLLNALHENFPLITRLFGYHAFNEEIGIPYLLKYPPNHWSLTLLGERLSRWIEEDYHAPDRPLILNAALLDWAFTSSFISPKNPPLNNESLSKGNMDELLTYTFYLQPYIHLFKWEYDLLTFRDDFLKKDVDYWTQNDFPELKRERSYHFLVFRNLKNHVGWKEISPAQFVLLGALKNGSTIEAACEKLEQQDQSIVEDAVKNLQEWFQEWTKRHWLTLQKEYNPLT